MSINPRRLASKLVLAAAALFFTFAAIATLPARTLVFDTNEVTQPGITATPGGRSVIFNLQGHLIELPVSGGEAKQLTFGALYDSDPVVTPDG